MIRTVLARENRLRDAEPINDEEEDYAPVIEGITEDGNRVEVKVNKVRSPNPKIAFVNRTDILLG